MSNTATQFTHNADELGQYRSLSLMAVAALLLGLASPLAFVGKLLLVIPLTAVACAFVALARIRASETTLTGRPVALTGIALAVLFAVASLTHVAVRDHLSIRLASETAHRWLGLISAGKLDQSLDVMTPEALMKLQPTPSRDAPPAPFDRAKALEMLGMLPFTHMVEAAAAGQEVNYALSDEEFYWVARDPEVGCLFRAHGAAAADEVEGTIVLKRLSTPDGEVTWLVNSYNVTKPSPADFDLEHHHDHHH